MTAPHPPAPSVYAYLDFRRYLEDWLTWKREVRPDYTFAVFARLARLSRSALPNILDGRRQPGAATFDGIARALGLGPEERGFLALLVDLQSASNLSTNSEILRQIFDHPNYAAGQVVDTSVIEVLSSWVRIALVELAKLPDFQPDPAWIAPRLRPAALAALQAEGLVATAGGEPPPHRLATPVHVSSILARRCHQSFLDAAKDALQQVPRERRTYQILTVAVPSRSVPDILAQVERFHQDLREQADSLRAGADTVVQVNIQAWELMDEPRDS